ncbi:hypothetical protein NOX90_03565 [Wolbachia endosymbiont of Anurida maritima]
MLLESAYDKKFIEVQSDIEREKSRLDYKYDSKSSTLQSSMEQKKVT